MKFLRLLEPATSDTFKTVNVGPKLNPLAFDAVGLTLPVVDNAVTVTHWFHPLLSSGNTPQRRLNTINGGDPFDILVLWLAVGSANCVVNHGGGNLKTNGSFTLNTIADRIVLVYDGAFWNELARSVNG